MYLFIHWVIVFIRWSKLHSKFSCYTLLYRRLDNQRYHFSVALCRILFYLYHFYSINSNNFRQMGQSLKRLWQRNRKTTFRYQWMEVQKESQAFLRWHQPSQKAVCKRQRLPSSHQLKLNQISRQHLHSPHHHHHRLKMALLLYRQRSIQIS